MVRFTLTYVWGFGMGPSTGTAATAPQPAAGTEEEVTCHLVIVLISITTWQVTMPCCVPHKACK